MNELAVVTQSGDNNRLLVRNAFYGDGGFNDGGYLERYERETVSRLLRVPVCSGAPSSPLLSQCTCWPAPL